jgi:hypothetical protein
VLNTSTVVGSVSSCKQPLKIVTVKEQLAVNPTASVAVQLTVVTPRLKLEPDGGEQTAVTPGQLSEAVGGG